MTATQTNSDPEFQSGHFIRLREEESPEVVVCQAGTFIERSQTLSHGVLEQLRFQYGLAIEAVRIDMQGTRAFVLCGSTEVRQYLFLASGFDLVGS